MPASGGSGRRWVPVLRPQAQDDSECSPGPSAAGAATVTVPGGEVNDEYEEEEMWQKEQREMKDYLVELCGDWVDLRGSSYTLTTAAGTDESLDVHTVRPTGKVIHTKKLINIRWRGTKCNIVWGRPGGQHIILCRQSNTTIAWERKGVVCFEWRRKDGEKPSVNASSKVADKAELEAGPEVTAAQDASPQAEAKATETSEEERDTVPEIVEPPAAAVQEDEEQKDETEDKEKEDEKKEEEKDEDTAK